MARNVSRWFMLPSCFSFPIQQSGHLDVVVPPDILNAPELSADESVTNEGGNVQLMCQATGVPEPRLVLQCAQLHDPLQPWFAWKLMTPFILALYFDDNHAACSGDERMEKTSLSETRAETDSVMNLINLTSTHDPAIHLSSFLLFNLSL